MNTLLRPKPGLEAADLCAVAGDPSPDRHHDAARTADELQSLLAQTQARVDELSKDMIALQRRAALGAVAGLLAHEVNNILTPVLARVRLARKPDADDTAVQSALEAAEDCVGKTAEIARAILALGKGGTTDQPAAADVLDTVRLALAALGRDLGRDGITCELKIGEGLRVAMSPSSLQQVFVNLVQNARNALLDGPAGGRRLVIEARHLPRSTWNTAASRDRAAAGGIEIEVRDTGPGISPEKRAAIFEPYTRSREEQAGTGLGLTVCRELIAAAGGTIDLVPDDGANGTETGARFVIRLPRPVASDSIAA